MTVFGATNRTISRFEKASGFDSMGETKYAAPVSSDIKIWLERKKRQILNPDKTVSEIDAQAEGDFSESFETDDILEIANEFLTGNPIERWRVVSRDEGQGITLPALKRQRLFLQKVR